MLEADHQFRRVNGHLHLPKLRAALEAHFKNVSAASQNEDQKAVMITRAATEVQRNSGQPPVTRDSTHRGQAGPDQVDGLRAQQEVASVLDGIAGRGQREE